MNYCNCKARHIEIEDGTMWITVMDGCTWSFEINFCPICGKCVNEEIEKILKEMCNE